SAAERSRIRAVATARSEAPIVNGMEIHARAGNTAIPPDSEASLMGTCASSSSRHTPAVGAETRSGRCRARAYTVSTMNPKIGPYGRASTRYAATTAVVARHAVTGHRWRSNVTAAANPTNTYASAPGSRYAGEVVAISGNVTTVSAVSATTSMMLSPCRTRAARPVTGSVRVPPAESAPGCVIAMPPASHRVAARRSDAVVQPSSAASPRFEHRQHHGQAQRKQGQRGREEQPGEVRRHG